MFQHSDDLSKISNITQLSFVGSPLFKEAKIRGGAETPVLQTTPKANNFLCMLDSDEGYGDSAVTVRIRSGKVLRLLSYFNWLQILVEAERHIIYTLSEMSDIM